MIEFSKRFIKVAVIVWIIGAVFGAVFNVVQLYIVAVSTDYTTINIDLTGYLMYIATPLTGGILGYMGKAAFENREKIKQNFSFRKAFGNDRYNNDNASDNNTFSDDSDGNTDSANQI
jgi:hypothetical protein